MCYQFLAQLIGMADLTHHLCNLIQDILQTKINIRILNLTQDKHHLWGIKAINNKLHMEMSFNNKTFRIMSQIICKLINNKISNNKR
jgi:hypothetical protein